MNTLGSIKKRSFHLKPLNDLQIHGFHLTIVSSNKC